MAYLALVRHGQSEWNALGLWTGLRDVSLVDAGREEARRAGEAIHEITFTAAYTSVLRRAQDTLQVILDNNRVPGVPATQSAALNERDYGDLTAKNKWEIRDQYGEEQFMAWRRGWDSPIPNGETLKDVHARVVPYYQTEILPRLRRGENVLVVAHGNSLRALVKHLESISDEGIADVELGTAEVYLYDIDSDGQIRSKEIRAANANVV